MSPISKSMTTIFVSSAHDDWTRQLALYTSVCSGEAAFVRIAFSRERYDKLTHLPYEIQIQSTLASVKMATRIFYIESEAISNKTRHLIIQTALANKRDVFYVTGQDIHAIETIDQLPIERIPANTLSWKHLLCHINTSTNLKQRNESRDNLMDDNLQEKDSHISQEVNPTYLNMERRARLFGLILEDYLKEAEETTRSLAKHVWLKQSIIEKIIEGCYPIDILDERMIIDMCQFLKQEPKLLLSLTDTIIHTTNLPDMWFDALTDLE